MESRVGADSGRERARLIDCGGWRQGLGVGRGGDWRAHRLSELVELNGAKLSAGGGDGGRRGRSTGASAAERHRAI